MGILTKIKLAAALARVALTGKHSKIFDRIDGGIELADKVREFIPQKKKEKRNK